jgi:hypothetical protein
MQHNFYSINVTELSSSSPSDGVDGEDRNTNYMQIELNKKK